MNERNVPEKRKEGRNKRRGGGDKFIKLLRSISFERSQCFIDRFLEEPRLI